MAFPSFSARRIALSILPRGFVTAVLLPAYGYIRGRLLAYGCLPARAFGATEIRKGLWLGNINDAHNLSELRRRNIRSVVTVIRGCRPSHPRVLHYHVVPALDVPEQNLLQYLDAAHAFIGDRLQHHNESVLVHCMRGASRSASVVVSFLMKTEGISMDEALQGVQSLRAIVELNNGFTQQLREFEKRLQAQPRHPAAAWLPQRE